MDSGRNRATQQTFANNIQTVEKVLKIKILNSAFVNGLGNEGVPVRSISTPNNLPGTLEELEPELTQFREGKRLLEVFRIHRP